jgi:serine/threonine-protein kinase
MLLQINEVQKYNLIEESRIDTQCGALYRGQDLNLGRTVAVKNVNILGATAAERNANYQKALGEVRAMVRIAEEPIHVPKIFCAYYDRKSELFSIVMEWINGSNLSAHMGVPEIRFLNWMIELCRILEKMEQHKLYHKDIKPANIMIAQDQSLYLIDFNISISTPNRVEGSLHYKAPEMDERSQYPGRDKVDQFSIGVLLYEFYTGAVPVRGEDHAQTRPRGPREWDHFVQPKEKNPALSDAVNQIILKCMRLDPRQRYSRVTELKYQLEKVVRELRGSKNRK